MSRLKVEAIKNIRREGCEVELRNLHDGTVQTVRVAISPNLQADKIYEAVETAVKTILERDAEVDIATSRLKGVTFEIASTGVVTVNRDSARGGGEAVGGTESKP